MDAANLKSMLSERARKELRRRASIIREGVDINDKVESFISKYSHPNHRSNDSALVELADAVLKLLSERKGLSGQTEGFERALSELTNMIKSAETAEGGAVFDGDAQRRFLVRYIAALAYRISYNVILHQAGFVSYRFVKLTRSSDLDVVSKKATIVSKFPLGFFSREKEEIDFHKNTFEAYKAEWQVLRAVIFRANTTLVPFDTKQLEGIEWLHRLNTTIAGHLDWVAQFEENPASLIRLNQGTQFLTMVSNSGALKPLLYQEEDPEELWSYSGMQCIFELRERANLGKPISINDYLVARAEYIMNYAKAKRVNFVFYSL